MVSGAHRLGYSALALTDVNTMAGSILFLQECRQQEIRPILGLELADSMDPSIRVVLLARTGAGYGDLCELATRHNLGSHGPFLENLFIRAFPDLFALCPHPDILRKLSRTPLRQSLFGAICLVDAASVDKSHAVETVCDQEGLELAIAHDCWFLHPEDHELHRLLRAIDGNTDLSRLGPNQVAHAGSWLLPPNRLKEAYARYPRALEVTERIVDACRDDLAASPWILPKVDVPSGFDDDSWLSHLSSEGLTEHYAGKPEYNQAKALQAKELDVIRTTGYAGYFLMVRRIREAAGARFATGFRGGKECSLLRGSAANCLTLYNLGASDLDPIKYGLCILSATGRVDR
jgi:DNA polymerase III alpha subunit